MKRIIALVFFVVTLAIAGSAQFKFGAGGSLQGGSLGLQAKVHSTFTEKLAAQGSFTYFLESGFTFYAVDLDMHFFGLNIVDLKTLQLTPFTGLNITKFSGASIQSGSTNLNLGINGIMPLTESMDIYIEPKIIIGISAYNNTGFTLSFGVYF